MTNKVNVRNIVISIVLLIILAVCAVWMLRTGIKHIDDTNGEKNYALQQITDENIIKQDRGSIGAIHERASSITNTTSYYARKFTGVGEIYYENTTTALFEITVNNFYITSGNMKLVLLVDDEIVHEFTPNKLTQTFSMKNVKGTVSLRVAGESAAFEFDYYTY